MMSCYILVYIDLYYFLLNISEKWTEEAVDIARSSVQVSKLDCFLKTLITNPQEVDTNSRALEIQQDEASL